ncbi:MAG: DUF3120 domain-containing protein [Snowella sp.]|nr:DUF3120 domain-containing protein [Snowella sp.]
MTAVIANYARPSVQAKLAIFEARSQKVQAWLILFVSGFLVSVPVFLQAPLVRLFPWLSLLLTVGWVTAGWKFMQRPQTQIWGDLLLGFSWSWLAGSIYWGWFRWEPYIHLPIEAIGLPFALWGLSKRWGIIGNLFYIGSLTGTVITDIYFYLTGLIEYWRQLMIVDPDFAGMIFVNAIAKIQTPWGISWAILLVGLLLGLGRWALEKTELQWWAFAGAVLSTILVDSLFWIAAILA